MNEAFFAALLALCLAAPAFAASDKIDPETYICAELLASNTSGEPPLFEGLQMEGYAAQKSGQVVADPSVMEPMLISISDICQAVPTDKVLPHWNEIRKNLPIATEGPYRADKTTCGEYYADEDNGSGFLIWLDGWQRAKNGRQDSIFENQATLDKFLAACKNAPDKLIIDVIGETLKK